MTLLLPAFVAAVALGQPAEPKPRILAGIEIGSKGVKALVLAVRAAPGKPVPDIEQLYAKTIDTSVLLLDGKKFSPPAVQETAVAVKTFVDTIQKDHPTLTLDNLFVVSSSAVSDIEDWQTLADQIMKLTKIPLQKLSLARECRLGIQGVLPDEDMGEAVMLDIGSGNVKCGYFEPGDDGPVGHVPQFKMLWYLDIPGTMEFTKLVQKKLAGPTPPAGGFDAAAAALRKDWITTPVARAGESRAGIFNRKKWYMAGGSVWLFTSVMFPDKAKDRFVEFTAADVKAFRERVRATAGVFPEPRVERIEESKLTAPLKAAAAAAAKKQIKAVQDKFSAENAAAAGEILLGFVEACKLDLPNRKVQLMFARDGTFGWLLALVKEDLVASDNEPLLVAPPKK